MNLSPFGENGIRILFGDAITLDIHEKVRRCYFFLKALGLPEIIDITPSFAACVILFDSGKTSFAKLQALLAARESAMDAAVLPDPTVHDIPVHYGGAHGPDMPFVCTHTGLSEEEVVQIHTAHPYTVFTVGFIPGFPYMGILDRRLHAPRLETPRIRVPKGSVGIAQLQTGVYPFESPAGWQIIGQTEARLFNDQAPPYSLMQIGDLVRFYSV